MPRTMHATLQGTSGGTKNSPFASIFGASDAAHLPRPATEPEGLCPWIEILRFRRPQAGSLIP